MKKRLSFEAFIVPQKEKSKSNWGALTRFLTEPDDDEDEDDDEADKKGEGKEPASDDKVELDPAEPSEIITDPTTKDSENTCPDEDKDQKKGTTAAAETLTKYRFTE